MNNKLAYKNVEQSFKGIDHARTGLKQDLDFIMSNVGLMVSGVMSFYLSLSHCQTKGFKSAREHAITRLRDMANCCQVHANMLNDYADQLDTLKVYE